MKTFKNIISFVAAVVFAISALTSCSTDSTSPVEDTSFLFKIAYSTGEAVWTEDDPQELVLNKLGVGTTGTIPFLIVNSNTYWTIEVPDQCSSWLSVSPIAGPTPEVVATDDKTTNVYLTVTENKGETRTGEFFFNFASGKKLRVPIRQKGPMSSGEETLLTFLTDDFGRVDAEDVRVKFYPFSKVDASGVSKHTYDGIAVAGDPTGRPFSYAGTENCYASDDVPSEGYLDPEFDKAASGGANIKIDGEGFFDVCVFNNQGETNFRMSFGAINTDGKFRQKDFKVWISCDGVNWDVDKDATKDGSIQYTHSEPVKVNGWSLNTTDFSIVPGVSNILYFRFQNLSSDVYRLDDILITELNGESDQIFSLIQTGSDIIGIPVSWNFQNLNSAETKGQYWMSNDIVLSEESGVYKEETEDYTPPTIPETVASAAHVQFMTGTDESRVKIRTDLSGRGGCGITIADMMPRVYGMMQGDYWIYTLPVHKVAASSNIKINFTYKNTAAGPKYMFFEWAQCTNDEYKFHQQNILALGELEKREFYSTLDWQVAETETVPLPNDEDVCATTSGIPMGSASSPKAYYKSVGAGGTEPDVVYSKGFKSNRGSDADVEFTCNFKEAMDDGYLFFRLRAAHDITAGACNSTDYQRINNSTHQGTSYLTKTTKFTFVGTGATPEFENAYRILAMVNPGDDSGYDGADPIYMTEATLPAAGVYFADTVNAGLASSGNNLFNGSCENDVTGAAVRFYSPYSSLNDTADPEDILLTVPATQAFTPGTLVANSVPTTLESDLQFKTSNTMRAKVAVRSAMLKISAYASKTMSANMSRIEVTTVNPEDASAPTTNIAGSYHYDLTTNTMGEAATLTTTITTEALEAIKVPITHKDAADIYVGLWEGTHKLYVKFYVGTLYYLGVIDTAEYVNGKMNEAEFIIDKLPSFVATDKLTGIGNAEQLKQFLLDVASGKTGKALDQYRNIDGELGFGGAALEADRVIDMAGVNMATWPDATLHENFNGGGYVIKNMIVRTPFKSLFRNIDHGYTISNFTLDSSCKLIVVDDYDTWSSSNWSLVCNGGTISTSATHEATGSFYNLVSYAPIDISADPQGYNSYVGFVLSYGSAGNEETDVQSSITNCINYGDITIHDYTQTSTGTSCWNGYKQWAAIIGYNAGFLVDNCHNYGNISVEYLNSPYGAYQIGGICGYNTNRLDNNTATTMFGNIHNCVNHGKITVGQKSRVLAYWFELSGIVPRMQWAHVTGCTNKGEFNIKCVQSDAWGGKFSKWPTKWADQIAATTNSIARISVGGCLCFAQNNIATGAEFSGLTNEGDIYCEIDSEDDCTITYADNCGICVGGCIGSTGANAYNPLISGCTNVANVTLKSNHATNEAFVGGVVGLFASNQHTSTAYNPTMRGSSNSGNVTFLTDKPDEVIAHVGGIGGAMLYGTLQSCVNVGTITNQSHAQGTGIAKNLTDVHLESTCAAIIGCQHRSTITAVPAETNIKKKPLIINGCAAGGIINGVKVNESNYEQYIYQRYETTEPEMTECYFANFGN